MRMKRSLSLHLLSRIIARVIVGDLIRHEVDLTYLDPVSRRSEAVNGALLVKVGLP
jgi:hypothetical protein